MQRRVFKSLLPLAFALCCAAAAPAAAQEPCRLERSVAPDYGGVMLGMTAEELARMFPGSDDLQRAPKAGQADASSKPFVASLGMLELGVRKEHFGDAGELLLTFDAGRLRRIDVRYRQPVEWNNVAEFSGRASRRLAVPADAWEAVASDGGKQTRSLECRGFSVVVRMDKGGPSTLSIVDTAAASAGPGAAAAPAPSPATPKRRPRKGRGSKGGTG